MAEADGVVTGEEGRNNQSFCNAKAQKVCERVSQSGAGTPCARGWMKRQKEQQGRTNRLGVPVRPLGQYDQLGAV